MIIIYDKKTKQFGNYLLSKLGDNKNIQAISMDIKTYNNNSFQYTNHEKLIFVGKINEDETKFIPLKYEKFGMKYGWLGNKAVIYVEDEILNYSDYNEFIKYSKNFNKNIKAIKNRIETPKDKSIHESFDNIFNNMPIIKKIWNFSKNTENKIHLFEMKISKEEKEINYQQYITLINIFYNEALNKFNNK